MGLVVRSFNQHRLSYFLENYYSFGFASATFDLILLCKNLGVLTSYGVLSEFGLVACLLLVRIGSLNRMFVKNIMKMIMGTSFAQAIPILMTPVFTRLYSPEDFGKFAIFLSCVSVFVIVSTGRYEQAIIAVESCVNAKRILIGSVLLSITVNSLLAILIVSNVDLLIECLRWSVDERYLLYTIPIAVFLGSVNQFYTSYLNRKEQYGKIAVVKVANASTLCTTHLFLSHLNVMGLVFGYIAGQVSQLILNIWHLGDENFGRENFKEAALALYRNIEYPLFNAPSAVINSISLHSLPIIMTYLFNATVTGYFSVAQRLMQLPMRLVGYSVSQVYFRQAATLKDDSKRLVELTYWLINRLMIVAFFPFFATLFFGESIFGFVLGQKWSIAGRYASCLFPWLFVVFVTSPLSNLLITNKRQKELFIFNVTLLITRIVTIVFLYILTKKVEIMLFGLSVVSALSWLSLQFFIFTVIGEAKANVLKKMVYCYAIVAVSIIYLYLRVI